MHRQMDVRHEFWNRLMRVNQLLRHVDRMTGRVAQTYEPVDPRETIEQARKAPFPASFARAAIGVDVLADEGDLADARVDETLRLGEHVGDAARNLGAARIGHHAKGAEFVAAFLHGDEGRDAARADLRASRIGQSAELVVDREVGVGEAPPVFRLSQQFGQAMIALRADDEIDGALALEHFFALRLGDAAGDDDFHLAPLRVAFAFGDRELAEFGIDFLGRLFTDMAGVEDDEIGVVFAVRFGVALAAEQVRHARRVIDIHLAAVGLHQNLGSHALCGREPLLFVQRVQNLRTNLYRSALATRPPSSLTGEV